MSLMGMNGNNESSRSAAVGRLDRASIAQLIRYPDRLSDLSAREFEQLIANLLVDFGWQIQWASFDDRGYDLSAVSTVAPGLNTTWLIECKAQQQSHPIGVEPVRVLYGSKMAAGVSNALFATTGRFTQGAKDFAHSKLDLLLADCDQIVNWLKDFRRHPPPTVEELVQIAQDSIGPYLTLEQQKQIVAALTPIVLNEPLDSSENVLANTSALQKAAHASVRLAAILPFSESSKTAIWRICSRLLMAELSLTPSELDEISKIAGLDDVNDPERTRLWFVNHLPYKYTFTPAQLSADYLDVGKNRFEEVRRENIVANPRFGTFEVAIVIVGYVPVPVDLDDFYKKLQLNKPHHSGWSLWIGDSYPAGKGTYVFDDAWESLTAAPFHEFDFWRAEKSGRFYHLRPLWDDYHPERGIVPQTYLDFALHASHVAEAVSIGSYFAHALGCDTTTTTLGIACRWTGLRGRKLFAWSEPDRGTHGSPAHQDTKTTSTTMSLETPEPGFANVVENLVAPLFETFGGMRFQSTVIEGIVRKTLSQRY